MNMRKLILAILAACVGSPALANTCTPIRAGATSQTVYVSFIDESTGIPTAGLAYTESGIDLEYVRTGAAAADITEATQTAGGGYSEGGFVSVGHGRYRLDLPDAAVASGVREVVVQGVITGYIMLPCTVFLDTAPTSSDLSSAVGSVSVVELQVSALADMFNTDSTTDYASAVAGSIVQEIADNAGGGSLGLSDLGIVDSGTAAAYTAGTPSVTLDGTPAFADDDLNGMLVQICGSTQGYCLPATITDYTASSEVAVINAALATEMTGTITYRVYGVTADTTSADVWTEASRTLTELDEDNTTIDLNGSTIGTVTTAGSVTGAVGSVAANGITASSIATDAIGSDEIAATGAAEIIDNFETQSQADPTGFHVNVLEVGGTAQTANDIGGDTNSILDDTDDIGVAGAGLTALPDVDTLLALDVLATGTCDSGSTTICVDAERTEASADYWRGVAFRPLTGPTGQLRCVVDFNEGTDTLTFVPALTAAITTNTYQLVRDTNCIGVDPTYTP